jgi:small subunit ribosomal protein S1
VKVQVLKLDPENERISLSMKATQPGPWQKVSQDFQIGSIVTGTVKRLVSFGAFVEISPGVEGLVHISQIAHRHVATPQEVLKEGQEVNVKILDINPDEKRVSLSIKETEDAPAAPERPERDRDRGGERGGRGRSNRGSKEEQEFLAQNNQGSLNQSLGELFGDKLSKLK